MLKFGTISSYIKQLPGFHTSRKIVVIESDDWGSIRTPTKGVLNELERNGYKMRESVTGRYNMFDTLASSKDLEDLFAILTSVHDSNGNYCIITPMCLVANPDFKKIKESNFQEYYYEPFTVTLKRYPGCESSFELWKEGINRSIFIPQFHGREHLNIGRWMKLLQCGDEDALFAFNFGMWGISKRSVPYKPSESLQAAFYFNESSELESQKQILTEGLNMFKKMFGYSAKYFVPTNGPLSSKLEETLSELGIRYIQTARTIYKEPIGNGKTRTRLRYLGKKNRWGQIYMIRNCFFEPSEPSNLNCVDKCLKDIETAFSYRIPAIISSHRVNFIGSLHNENRENGLRKLKQLLDGIKKHWPEVEFMTADSLGKLINNQ